ncbi:toxin-antitoxin system YwqK family antitoxin [Brevibacillus brevis]|uniref:Toxin-antitoxin system YwqK family antitoxin n=1 Tax=Brevibacillus brevis (strain 47 / JCM 6285 / NBRC 100599) TaxID=358681 RepID=C0ZJ67_BREBN|nr:hypothetical protein [Brevibacillus brevis]WJQ80275.1 hypothetical protein QN310_22850 [Brevibacillus brevis]BAH45442.1 conserved hypothetical protein [Brevibacillus brevis NBRC 100599]
MEKIVDEEMLDYDDDIRTYCDQPFTGIGYVKYPNGVTKRETHYKDGFPHGFRREWFPNGKIQTEYELRRGKVHGRRTYWHSNDSIRSIGHYEWGVELDYTEWSENGELIEKRKLDPESPDSNYKILLKFREHYSKYENL